MDKETLSNYGWLMIVAIVGTLLLVLISPLSDFIVEGIKNDAIKELDNSSLSQPETVAPTLSTTGKTITFNTAGGTFSGDYITVYQPGKTLPLPTNITKENYDFAGWYPNASFNTSNWTQIPETATEDLILYAKWIPKRYIVSYNLNGGTFEEPNKVNYYYHFSEDFHIPSSTNYGKVSKEGKTFKGWYNTNTNKPFTYSNTTSGTISLYAKWE